MPDQSDMNMDGCGCLWRKPGMEKDSKKLAGVSDVVERMRERKRAYGFSYGEIATRAGIPLGTVQKVLGGFTKSPRHDTLEALARVLLPEQTVLESPDRIDRPAVEDPVPSNPQQGYLPDRANERNIYRKNGAGLYTGMTYEDITAGMLVQEGAPVYNVRSESPDGYDRNLRISGKRQGQFTIEDRNAIPEDRPSELIDGVIYNMASPTHRHQTAAGEIYRQLWNYVDSNGGNCMPFIAPADVRLDRDDDTMLVPDVFVVCESDDPKLSDEGYIDGAPDLVVEVLSPSTRKKDMFIKLEKYRNAGVREYWIVDLQKEKVIVYLFGEEPDIGLYWFDSRIPVGIYGGDCQIDFTEVVRNLKMAERLGRGARGGGSLIYE